MGLFGKKEAVPEIPTAPGLPELPKASVSSEFEKKSLPELPSFPNDSKNGSFNQDMVKSAVSDQDSSEEKESDFSGIPEPPKKEKAVLPEADFSPKPFGSSSAPTFPSIPSNNTPSLPSISESETVSRSAPIFSSSPVKQISREGEPIFVRIDKFQASQKNFDEIKDKISQIENILKKLKEVKVREEDELKGWTEDVENIKLKLGEIDSNIFSQI